MRLRRGSSPRRPAHFVPRSRIPKLPDRDSPGVAWKSAVAGLLAAPSAPTRLCRPPRRPSAGSHEQLLDRAPPTRHRSQGRRRRRAASSAIARRPSPSPLRLCHHLSAFATPQPGRGRPTASSHRATTTAPPPPRRSALSAGRRVRLRRQPRLRASSAGRPPSRHLLSLSARTAAGPVPAPPRMSRPSVVLPCTLLSPSQSYGHNGGLHRLPRQWPAPPPFNMLDAMHGGPIPMLRNRRSHYHLRSAPHAAGLGSFPRRLEMRISNTPGCPLLLYEDNRDTKGALGGIARMLWAEVLNVDFHIQRLETICRNQTSSRPAAAMSELSHLCQLLFWGLKLLDLQP
ncbi:hypothetical protein U9M48_015021 [Paspalum notatum var. saurae]|uniref:Uncharacterized protein n=1 Tax=Paspalum notatum var. saurae TaxID=547442 RepID=A0AAQ3T5K8_PASNO